MFVDKISGYMITFTISPLWSRDDFPNSILVIILNVLTPMHKKEFKKAIQFDIYDKKVIQPTTDHGYVVFEM